MRVDCVECGDALELLTRMEKETVDCIITSPPYYNLRDYDEEDQIGMEQSVKEYIDTLVEIFCEASRVLKKQGSLWVNIGDVYAKKDGDGVRKYSLLCIPDRFKIEMVKCGWICRNEIIWRKPNAMPSSAKNRFNNDFEKVFFFVKSPEYKFNTQYEPMKAKPTSHKNGGGKNTKYQSIEQETEVRQGMNRSRGNKIIEVRRNLPSQKQFVSFMRSKITADEISNRSSLSKTKVEHWFRKDAGGFAYPSVEDWNKVKWMIDDGSAEFLEIDTKLTEVSYETDDIMKNADRGRIKRAVWDISTKSFRGEHYAPYPEKLVETPILACTDEGDVVLDIFLGSGTTAVSAKKLGRHYIGFDLNPKYCDVARRRIEGSETDVDCCIGSCGCGSD